jgi:rod shape-determining protein MreD
MPFAIYVGALALGALVEATLGYRLEAGGGRANVVLLMVVAWSLIRGLEEGALAGLAGGLALDLVSGTPFGLYTAILTLIGAMTALGEATLHRGSLAFFFGTAVLVTVAYHGVAILVFQALGWEMPGFSRLVGGLVPTVLINAALMPVAFVLARRLFRALSGWRQLELE